MNVDTIYLSIEDCQTALLSLTEQYESETLSKYICVEINKDNIWWAEPFV